MDKTDSLDIPFYCCYNIFGVSLCLLLSVLRRRFLPMKLYIIRHGETKLNALGCLQGWTDEPLNQNGKDLAIITGEALKIKSTTTNHYALITIR